MNMRVIFLSTPRSNSTNSGPLVNGATSV
jgi:hypothetical protein